MIKTKLKIRLYGDPVLRKKSQAVEKVGPGERLLIDSMIETMRFHKGIGLAAPQVGINEQIIVADVGEGPIAIINPQILKRSGSKVMEEGCLSIPGILVDVRRPQKILVRYLNEQSQPVEKEFSDLIARVILHESDHLRGKLIVDYASLPQQIKMRKKLRAIEEGKIDVEAIAAQKKSDPDEFD